ncbi:MAG TPA: hypothetical protein ENN80_02295, partial [Candidatus Hydrogenedentes bacterium]|nr:hypothetical protein [Candidatus Hydrogenedentota bacterium]
MAKERSTLWAGPHIIDGFHRPKHPFALAAAILALVVAIDLLLAAALYKDPAHVHIAVENDTDVRCLLRHMKRLPEPVWLLIGDSVLAGDVMAGTVEDWRRHRVIDYMAREKAPQAPDAFRQIALNGLLPVDIARILAELDRIDPQGRIPVAIELTVRDFSPQYAALDMCTRDWLNNVAVPTVRDGRITWLPWIRVQFQAVGEWLGAHMPIYRHHRRIPWSVSLGEETNLATPIRAEAPPSRLAGMARLRVHYCDLVLDASTQIDALRECVARLKARNRRAVFFSIPLNDDFVADVVTPQDYGQAIAAMDRIVANPPVPNITLVHLDHSLFVPSLFIDHCHLFPDGNRLLAINLLHQMGIPLKDAPPRGEMVYPEEADTTLVWSAFRGDTDGAPWQARFRHPADIDVNEQNRIVVADRRNHCIRQLSGTLQTVRTIAGQPGIPGGNDGPARQAAFLFPEALCLLGDTVYVADNRGARLRRIKDGHVVTEYGLEGPEWSAISVLRSHNDRLYLLDAGDRILEYTPKTHATRIALERVGAASLTTFCIAPDGRCFVADSENHLWRTDALPVDIPPELFHRNKGALFVPEGQETFPIPLERLELRDVRDLCYVARYDGLLIQDRDPPKNDFPSGPTETIHLRFLRFADDLVYPWLKPRTFGGAYIMHNERSDSYVSLFHEGSMALQQNTAALFYLEHERSRLFVINDGVWGTAKISNLGAKALPGT